jgi:probable rRNA maturation factor
MPIDVDVVDEQDALAIDTGRWAALTRGVLESQGVSGEVEVSLHFVGAPAIAELHERYLGLPGPTDVLSFPIEDDPLAAPGAGAPRLLGDIVVCPSVAQANAAAHGVGLDDELALLVVHGLLHLLGMDHEVSEEAEEMEALERSLLAALHPPGKART